MDRDTVRRVAALARLELTPEEEERLAADLARIVALVDELPEVDPEEAAAGSAPVGELGPGAIPGPAEPEAAETAETAACTVPLGDLFAGNAPALEDHHLRLPPVRPGPDPRSGPGPGLPAPDGEDDGDDPSPASGDVADPLG